MEEIKDVILEDEEVVTTPSDPESERNEEALKTTAVPEFLNDNDMKSMQFLGMKSKVDDIKKTINDLAEKNKSLLNDSEAEKMLDEKIDGLTEAELMALSPSAISDIFSNDGKEIILDMPEMDEKKSYEFKRDYLLFRKKTNDVTKEFNKEMESIEKEIEESRQDFDDTVAQFGSVSKFVETKLNLAIENAKSDEEKERLLDYKYAMDCGTTLENVIRFVKSDRGAHVLGAYYNNDKAKQIHRRYLKVVKLLGLKQDLVKFPNVENHLGDEYDKLNLFVFTVIYMVSTMYNKPIRKSTGVFLSTLGINLKNLLTDKFDTEQEKLAFIESVKRVLDIRK